MFYSLKHVKQVQATSTEKLLLVKTCVRITKFPRSSKSFVACVLSGQKSVGIVILGAAISKSNENLTYEKKFVLSISFNKSNNCSHQLGVHSILAQITIILRIGRTLIF